MRDKKIRCTQIIFWSGFLWSGNWYPVAGGLVPDTFRDYIMVSSSRLEMPNNNVRHHHPVTRRHTLEERRPKPHCYERLRTRIFWLAVLALHAPKNTKNLCNFAQGYSSSKDFLGFLIPQNAKEEKKYNKNRERIKEVKYIIKNSSATYL